MRRLVLIVWREKRKEKNIKLSTFPFLVVFLVRLVLSFCTCVLVLYFINSKCWTNKDQKSFLCTLCCLGSVQLSVHASAQKSSLFNEIIWRGLPVFGLHPLCPITINRWKFRLVWFPARKKSDPFGLFKYVVNCLKGVEDESCTWKQSMSGSQIVIHKD